MRVLIVDDDPFTVDTYALKLREAGFESVSASDGRKGLEEIRSGRYDIVLIDVVLPTLDGFEILETLRREGAPHPPIVLLTNLGSRADVDRGMSLGAVDYIIKAHFTPSEVVEKVRGILKNHTRETLTPARTPMSGPR